MKLLHVDSSILGDNSVSRKVSAAVTAHFQAAQPDVTVTYEDLAANPFGHLSIAHLAAAQGAAPADPIVEAEVARGQKALQDFLEADIVVVGAPLYNFTIPSQLKAWIDRLSVAGKTFRYTEKGPEGLAGGKTLIIVSSQGGLYNGTARAAQEHQESYLRALFNFLGITDIRVVRADGVNIGPEQRQEAIDKALQATALLALPKVAAPAAAAV